MDNNHSICTRFGVRNTFCIVWGSNSFLKILVVIPFSVLYSSKHLALTKSFLCTPSQLNTLKFLYREKTAIIRIVFSTHLLVCRQPNQDKNLNLYLSCKIRSGSRSVEHSHHNAIDTPPQVIDLAERPTHRRHIISLSYAAVHCRQSTTMFGVSPYGQIILYSEGKIC